MNNLLVVVFVDWGRVAPQLGVLVGVDGEGQTDYSEGNAHLSLFYEVIVVVATTNGHSEGDVAARRKVGRGKQTILKRMPISHCFMRPLP